MSGQEWLRIMEYLILCRALGIHGWITCGLFFWFWSLPGSAVETALANETGVFVVVKKVVKAGVNVAVMGAEDIIAAEGFFF
jgi:hypothetical protein